MSKGFSLDSIAPDRASPASLQQQVYQKLRMLIERHVLAPGMALPSTRVLAQDLSLGRNTVIAAYDQLVLEGYLMARPGVVPVVRDLLVMPPPAKRPESDSIRLSVRGTEIAALPFHHCAPGVTAFHPGLPDSDQFPFNTWSRMLMRRARLARGDLFGTYHVTGYPDLREAIARYLTASRGVVCTSEQVVVTNGAQSAFDVLARLLLDPGDTVWMEEPGYYGATSAFLAAGARLAPLYVQNGRWLLDPPEGAVPRAIFVTPSCHHPLGLTMSMVQRLDLIRLAETWDSWIIEDDYDSEYRFQGQPIPALQGVTPGERTIFVGTFAKILFPAMRLGYMVVPRGLLPAVNAALSATGQFAPLLTQAALADFMNGGHLARHLRRMRRLYGQRRELFISNFNALLGDSLRLCETDTGIQMVAMFLGAVDDRHFAATAAQEGVNVSPLSMQFRHSSGISGLVLGFAAADPKTQERAIRRLAAIAEQIIGKTCRGSNH